MLRSPAACASLALFVAACSTTGHVDAGNDAALPDATPPDDAAADAPADAGVDAPACTTDWDAGPRADAGAFTEAPHGPLANVVGLGGPVLAHPQLVHISYDTDPRADAYESFGDFVVRSSWLTTVGAEYGVGSGEQVATLRLPGPAPATIEDMDIAILIGRQILMGTVPTPPTLESDYVYMIHFPPSTTVTQLGVGICPPGISPDFVAGYHSEFTGAGTHYAYAVVAGCDPASSAGDYELTMSHELVEAATDPYGASHPAYVITDLSDPWSTTFGELGDLCSAKTVTSCGHRLTRVWSNVAAASGHSPCVPAVPGEVYFNVGTADSVVHTIAAGSTLDLPVTGFSDAPTSPWFAYAYVYPYFMSSFTPTVTLDHDTFSNGTAATLSITVPPGTPPGARATVYITSSSDRTTATYDYTIWPVAVVAR